MQRLLFTLFAILGTVSFISAQYIWTAAGDGTSWEDPANWNRNEVPLADSMVVFNRSDTITGTASLNPASIRIGSYSNVVLDLDLTIGNGMAPEHGFTFGDTCTLRIGLPGNTRTFTINAPADKHAIVVFGGSSGVGITVSATTTLNLMSGISGVNLANDQSTVLNEGTIIAGTELKDGFRVGGSFRNDGNISGGALERDLFNVKVAGMLVNGPEGSIVSDQPGDDGIEVVQGATFRNEGTLDLTAKNDASSGNNAIAVGAAESEGFFINNGENVTLNGGGGTGELSGRSLNVEAMGDMVNNGVISILGGAANSRLFVKGTAINGLNAIIDLTDGRFNVNALGTFTNNGLISSTRDGSGGFTAGTSVNNGFFDYANSNLFSGGANGIIEDKGFSLNNNDVRVNARNNCEVDLVNASYEWFLDGESYAMANDTGRLVFADNSVLEDSVLLTTTLPGVEIKVINICDQAVRPNSLFGPGEQLQKITLFPNPVSRGQALSIDLSGLELRPYSGTIFDGSGRSVRQFKQLPGGRIASLYFNELPRGIYHLRLDSGPGVMGGSFMIR